MQIKKKAKKGKAGLWLAIIIAIIIIVAIIFFFMASAPTVYGPMPR